MQINLSKIIHKILLKILCCVMMLKKQKGCGYMASISPVSDLRNYNEKFENTKAMLRLMCELNEGKSSGEEEGYVSSEDVQAYFQRK